MLIAEIGMNHMGSDQSMKDHIKAAVDSGADLVKGQAFLAKDITGGSMPPLFYELCEEQHLYKYELWIQYAQDLGSDMFFSIFSEELDDIHTGQNYHKSSATHTRKGCHFLDISTWFISVPRGLHRMPQAKSAQILHVNEYMNDDPDLMHIKQLESYYGRKVGLSDHSVGTDACEEAINGFGVEVIEKHFTLKKNRKFEGQVFRDTVHGADPKELEKIAKLLK